MKASKLRLALVGVDMVCKIKKSLNTADLETRWCSVGCVG